MQAKFKEYAGEVYRHFFSAELLEMMGLDSRGSCVTCGHVEKRLTILFCDIRNFTLHTERMSPGDSLGFVNSFMGTMEPAIRNGGGVIDKYIGDAVMAVFPASADDGVGAAVSMLEALRRLNLTRDTGARLPIKAGIGLNTGMAMIGAVGGRERLEPTVVSDAVNLASRLEELTKTYEAPVIISENTLYGMKDPGRRKARFLDRIRVKGKSQPQSVYEIFDNDQPAQAETKERLKPVFEEAAAYYHLKVIDRAKKLFRACHEAAPDDGPAKFYINRCELYERTGRHEGTCELDGTLEWRGEFEVGVPTIDAQHRQLLGAMNKVAPLIKAGDTSALEELFDFLGKYAVTHFNYEQGLMEKAGYPFYEAHKAEHRRFVAHFARLAREVTTGAYGRLFLIFKVQIFLSDWFACHSTGMDRHLAIYLRDPARAGLFPEAVRI